MRTIDEIWADITALVDGAEGRRLTADEVAAYKVLEAELKAAQDDDAIRGQYRAYNTVVVPAGVPAPSPSAPETIDNAYRSYLRTGKGNADIADLLVLGPDLIGMPQPRNAQAEGFGPSGGYLVPQGFRDKIVERMKRVGGLAEVVEVLNTETGQTLPWPVLDDTANSGQVVDENTSGTVGADILFDTQDLGAYSYQAGGINGDPLKLPWELMQDSVIDIEGMLARLLGKRLGRALALHLVLGTGVKQPLGLVYGRVGLPATATAPTYGDLVDAMTSVDIDYWENGRWAMNQVSLGKVWKMVDSHGDPIWRPATQGGALEDGFLLGKPITVDNGFPNFLTTAGTTTNWAAYGDLEAGYVLRQVRDIALVVNPYSSAKNRQNEYTAWMRSDGRPQDTFAYTALAGKA